MLLFSYIYVYLELKENKKTNLNNNKMSETTQTLQERIRIALGQIDKQYKETFGKSDISIMPITFFSQKSSGFATDGEFAGDLAMVFNIIKSQGHGMLCEYKVEYSFRQYDGIDAVDISILRPKRK